MELVLECAVKEADGERTVSEWWSRTIDVGVVVELLACLEDTELPTVL